MKLTTKEKILLPLRVVVFAPILVLAIADFTINALSALLGIICLNRGLTRLYWRRAQSVFS